MVVNYAIIQRSVKGDSMSKIVFDPLMDEDAIHWEINLETKIKQLCSMD